MSRALETRCIHGENTLQSSYGAVSFPIYQTATFAHPGIGQSTGYDYSRSQNPTREQLERVVASLENGTDALGFSTGMAAIALLLEIFKPGDHLIVEEDLYGGSVRLFREIGEKNGLEFTSMDIAQEDVGSRIRPNTKAVFIETPTNPMMHVVDIRKLAELCKKHGLLLIVDNTFLSPYFQNPLDLGADVVVHSGTKYLGGHNDTLAGFLVVKDGKLAERLRFLMKTTGAVLSPFDSWLILRGIQTLAVRMRAAEQNAIRLAEWLKTQSAVKQVYYPGLPKHPGYEIMKKQARGFGAMISFNVTDKEKAFQILKNIKIIKYAESLGGLQTLITYPLTQTHADVPKELLQKNGITERLLRLSVGIEDAQDLIDDLEQAFFTGI